MEQGKITGFPYMSVFESKSIQSPIQFNDLTKTSIAELVVMQAFCDETKRKVPLYYQEDLDQAFDLPKGVLNKTFRILEEKT